MPGISDGGMVNAPRKRVQSVCACKRAAACVKQSGAAQLRRAARACGSLGRDANAPGQVVPAAPGGWGRVGRKLSWAWPGCVCRAQGNPCVEEPDYRLTMIHRMPHLHVLDQHVITAPERRKAAALIGGDVQVRARLPRYEGGPHGAPRPYRNDKNASAGTGRDQEQAANDATRPAAPKQLRAQPARHATCACGARVWPLWCVHARRR